jgi:chromosome segregation ATPase
MARSGVTYQEVAKAATQLAQIGQVPTIDRVRSILGTGSKSTLAPLLKQWKAQQAETISEAETGLPRALITVVKGLYESVQQQAQTRIETAQEENRREVDAAWQAQKVAEGRQRELEAVLEQQQRAYTRLEADHTTLKAAWEESQQTRGRLLTQTEALAQRLGEQAHRVQDLKHHLVQAQQNLEHYRESVRQQRTEERADFERQLGYGEQALKKAREENQALRTANAQLEKAALQWQSQCERQQAEGVLLTEKVESLSQAMEQLRQQLAMGEGQYKVLAQAHQQAIAELRAREQDLLKQEKATAVAQEKFKALSAALQEAKDHKVRLQNENKILAKEKAHLEGQYKQLQRACKLA